MLKSTLFFVALMSAAAGTDLYTVFADTYHYPLVPAFYDIARAALTAIIAQRECPGDFDKDGSSDSADLAVFAMVFDNQSPFSERSSAQNPIDTIFV